MEIFKSIARLAAEFAVSMAREPERTNEESLDSISTPPDETPPGFNLDSDSDG